MNQKSNSNKIENKEFTCKADENDYFNLIASHKKEFDQFEYIFINLNQSDLEYSLNDYLNNNKSKLKVEKQNTFLYKYIYTKVKLFSSVNQMGFFERIRGELRLFKKNKKMELDDSSVHLDNFLSIKNHFIKKEFDNKIVYIINLNTNYQESFLNYLYNYKYIDLSTSFNQSNKSPYFLFDKHWNDIGRDLVSFKISDHINKSK